MLAVFDSGVGGLSVLREIRKVYKGDILYLGDTARAPYGNREKEEIITFTKQMLRFAQSCGATHFVSACNSISGNVTDELLKELFISQDRFIDMGSATEVYKDILPRTILVVATRATLASHLYRDIFDEGFLYDEIALSDLALAIENDDERGVDEALALLLERGQKSQVGAIFLGCTHYPLVLSRFKELFPQTVFVDPAAFVAKEVLKMMGLEQKEGKTKVYLSKESAMFQTTYITLFKDVPQICFTDFSLF